jgi:hypothetical protein
MTTFLLKLYRTRSFCFALLIILFSFGCGKNAGNVRWVYYDETKCADKWTTTLNNEALKQNVTSYLQSKGITIYEIEIFNDRTAESCGECYCKSGRRFKAKVRKSDLSEIKSEGFYQ